MGQKFRLEGIYDQRTLKHLKAKGVKNFSFNFSPKSFNFIQEYVFLEQIMPLLDHSDKIFFHFSRSNDPMIAKLIYDLKKNGSDLTNIHFEFDEWSEEMGPLQFDYNYLLHFSSKSDLTKMVGEHFRGLVFDFEFFEELYRKNLISSFTNNFYTRYAFLLSSPHTMMILHSDWHSNLMMSLFDLFEFDLLSMPINSKIEVCYRNVDLKKMTQEMDLIVKSKLIESV